MNNQTKIVIAVAVIVAVALLIGTYVLLNSALAPLEQKEVVDSNPTDQNVEIQAATFNGNIEIQTSTTATIEVTYNIETPKGHLNEITTATTNQTQSQNKLILVAEAKLETNEGLTVNHKADIIIKLPNTSQYNLTLHTSNGNIIKPQLNDTIVIANTDNGNINMKDDTSISAASQNGNVKISLVQDTLFTVDANTANGNVSYQGIALNTTTQTQTHFKGNTSSGAGNLNLTLPTANGNITIEYFSK